MREDENKQEQKTEAQSGNGQKHEKHLFGSDETIMQKYGVGRDEESEDDTEKGDPEARPPKPKDEKSRKKRRKMYIIIAIITALAIALILWLAIPNSGSSNYDNNMSGLMDDVMEVQEGYPAALSGTSVTTGNFFTMEKQLVYVSDTSIIRLNDKAEPVYERSHSYYHPIVKTSGENLIIYNVGSTGFRIDNKSETVRSEDAANIIMAADVAENGRYALVTETKGYPSLLEVYKEDGSLQYKYSFSNCYVSDISLSADGTRAAVVGVTASEGELVSQVYLLDFNSETPLAIADCSGTLLMAVEYVDNRALAVGDDCAVSVNDGGEVLTYDYEGMKLAAFDYNENRLLVALSPHDSASKGKLAVLNSKAEPHAVRNCIETMYDVSLYGDTMAALSDNVVYSYSVNAVRHFNSDNGEDQAAFHTTEAANDTKAIALADESSVFMLGISEVRFEDY